MGQIQINYTRLVDEEIKNQRQVHWQVAIAIRIGKVHVDRNTLTTFSNRLKASYMLSGARLIPVDRP